MLTALVGAAFFADAHVRRHLQPKQRDRLVGSVAPPHRRCFASFGGYGFRSSSWLWSSLEGSRCHGCTTSSAP